MNLKLKFLLASMILAYSFQSETKENSNPSSLPINSPNQKTEPNSLDKCNWSESAYDFNIYIRVIKSPTKNEPLSFVCWEKAKLTEFIFRNVHGCQLAINNKNGLECVSCMPGYTSKLEGCIKLPQDQNLPIKTL